MQRPNKNNKEFIKIENENIRVNLIANSRLTAKENVFSTNADQNKVKLKENDFKVANSISKNIITCIRFKNLYWH